MKPTATSATVQGDLGGQKIDMTIDQSALEHIMMVLTDLYSDPEMAVIREYSTNAWDSHVLAGITRPIEVTLPNQMTPYLRIRDYGVGLSVDELTDMYSKYGASTKRDSDEFNGTLGLGAKSALTYTNQFNIISVRNGVKITVLVSRNEKNVGVMEVVDTVSTTDPSGVMITIPTKDHNSVKSKADMFFSYWTPGTVLIDGQPPQEHPGQKITDTIYVDSHDYKDYVVMGNVRYPVNPFGYNPGNGYRRGFGITVHVNIGDVSFTPSREGLQYNDHTKAKLAEINTTLGKQIESFYLKSIENATTHAEALEAMWQAKKILGNFSSAPKWGGKQIETNWLFPGWSYFSTRTRGSVSRNYQPQYYHDIASAVVITDYPGHVDTVSVAHRNKARWWATANGITGTPRFLFLTDFVVPGAPWTDNITRVTWETVKSMKNPDPIARMYTQRQEKYDAVAPDGKIIEVSTFDSDDILYYSSAEERHVLSRYDRTYRETSYRPHDLRAIFPNHHIVRISKNRWDKFKRDWPTAVHIRDAAKIRAQEIGSNLSADDILWISVDEGGGKYELGRLATYKNSVLDPDVVMWIESAVAPEPARVKKFRADIASLNSNFGLAHSALDRIDTALGMRYPLINTSHMTESVEYINMIWSKRNG